MVEKKKYVLLDRDGTINVERKDYVKSYDEFIFLDGAIEGLRLLNDNNYNIILLTNQSPIGRGIFTHKDLEKIHTNMKNDLGKHGIIICDIFYCPSMPSENDFNRKPNPGMLLASSEKYGINLSETFFIGDKITDVEAGKRAGCKTILLENNNILSACKRVVEGGH